MSQKSSILVLIFFMCIKLVFSQESNTHIKNLSLFDSLIGIENTKLYNGKRYYNIYKAANNNHAFFFSTDYIKGSLDYNGQSFHNINLKYDLTLDKLITKLDGNQSFVNIELIKHKVNSFNIDSHHFINIKNITNDNAFSNIGFIELAYTSDNFKFLIKRVKKIQKKINQKKIDYIFKNKDSYYIFYQNTLKRIKSYKTLKKIFPNQVKNINSYYSSNKNLLEKNEEQFLNNLLKYIDLKMTNK